MERVYMERPTTPRFVRAIEITLQNAETIKGLLRLGTKGCTYAIEGSKIIYHMTYTDRPDEKPHRMTLNVGSYLIFEQDGELRPYPIIKDDLERRYMPIPVSNEYAKATAQQRISARAHDSEFE